MARGPPWGPGWHCPVICGALQSTLASMSFEIQELHLSRERKERGRGSEGRESGMEERRREEGRGGGRRGGWRRNAEE